MEYCGRCGATLRVDQRFCRKCGSFIGEQRLFTSPPEHDTLALSRLNTPPSSSTKRVRGKVAWWVWGGIVALLLMLLVAAGHIGSDSGTTASDQHQAAANGGGAPTSALITSTPTDAPANPGDDFIAWTGAMAEELRICGLATHQIVWTNYDTTMVQVFPEADTPSHGCDFAADNISYDAVPFSLPGQPLTGARDNLVKWARGLANAYRNTDTPSQTLLDQAEQYKQDGLNIIIAEGDKLHRPVDAATLLPKGQTWDSSDNGSASSSSSDSRGLTSTATSSTPTNRVIGILSSATPTESSSTASLVIWSRSVKNDVYSDVDDHPSRYYGDKIIWLCKFGQAIVDVKPIHPGHTYSSCFFDPTYFPGHHDGTVILDAAPGISIAGLQFGDIVNVYGVIERPYQFNGGADGPHTYPQIDLVHVDNQSSRATPLIDATVTSTLSPNTNGGNGVMPTDTPGTNGSSSTSSLASDEGGTGPTAECNDGTTSYSHHPSGTCSHHDGVAVWDDHLPHSTP